MKQIISIFVLVLSFGISAFAQSTNSNCATITVSGGGVVSAGTPMTFTVNIADLTDTAKLKYEWEISNGTIASDREAPTITVDTTGLFSDTKITAKVKVIGLPENCSNTASESGAIVPRCILPRIFDEFGRLSNNDVLARIQNLYVELDNNSDMQGYIINYGSENEFAARKRQIESAISRLKLDSSRVTIINGGTNPRETGIWTRVYIVPKDVDISPLTDYE
jgi:hypothetical protein